MIRYEEIEVAGLVRRLPLYQIDEDTAIARYVGFTDVELTVRAAEALLQQVAEFDVIVTEEVQGVPLAYEMTRQAGLKRFVVTRKQAKAYMEDVAAIQIVREKDGVETMTRRYLSRSDADYLQDKRVLLVDDLVVRGETFYLLSELTNALGGYVVGKASILKHDFDDDEEEMDDLITLVKLPRFTPEGVAIQK